MSDHIPFEMQSEIMKRLPIKSLIRFRSVSKPWKSLIDSSNFISQISVRANQPHHLLVRYKLDSERTYVSITENDTFPQHKFTPTVPLTLTLLRNALLLGSSHGFLCFYGFYQHQDYETKMVVFWNPSIRKSVGIVIPNVFYLPNGFTVIGFGVCPGTNDPKLVKITHLTNYSHEVDTITSWRVEVFTLSSRVWRSISVNLPCESVALTWNQVVIDGVIYWHAYDRFTMDDEGSRNLIISFDLTSEEFRQVYLPDRFAYCGDLTISKLNDSLVVLEYHKEVEKPFTVVWLVKDDVQNSFTKLFTINAPDIWISYRVLRFRTNGEPIMERIVDYEVSSSLEVYEPSSECITDLGIFGNGGALTSCSVTSYMETLHLLDQTDSIIHYVTHFSQDNSI